MDHTFTVFITWTTYGTWLPGEARGWRKRKAGSQVPQPLLEAWCREQMTGEVVLLAPHDRVTVEESCRNHCEHWGWTLYAVNARSNHVHVVVTAAGKPQTVRDQLKASCTGELRRQEKPLNRDRTWTRARDCAILDTDEELEAAI